MVCIATRDGSLGEPQSQMMECLVNDLVYSRISTIFKIRICLNNADDYRSGSLWLPKGMMSSFC